ncbi:MULTISPECIES: NAD(P)-dependent oxidoreductase [unclassified Enterococcus]|uniref:NAD-dependent epimerase/dehydratase family protein n=1 Tax=unclassified Enterococcus TaxID=2608891 RepID=UPI001BCF7CC7|nr:MULTISPECIES: NAD(P)-dependent oxidoreductase [unclassified Enterococcus]MBS7577283.1 NAD(P)-dependent oxidoreductase [Enterococcus sp. MMGLQ5-2]MBS7584624.1 NAD(P)-dependent oxidoreductase [Enterococcus sp. MMGLQ5-1]
MKVAITGANGYIGRHVVNAAIKAGHEVYAIDIDFKNVPNEAKRIEIDIFDHKSNVFQLMAKPDVLIHLAWRDGFIHNSEQHMKNLSDHVQFIRNYVKHGGKNVAVMGSMHEIGYHEGAIDENTPCNPLSQYGVAKNAMRQSLLLAAKELNFNLYWLRAYYIFGDDRVGSSIFAKLTLAADEGKKTFPFTTGKNKFDFISVQELGKMIVAASTQDKITGVINVSTGNPKSLAEQIEWYIKVHHWDIKLEYGAFPDRPYDSPAIWGDATKIQQIMGEVDGK